jgi:hypothetical protein
VNRDQLQQQAGRSAPHHFAFHQKRQLEGETARRAFLMWGSLTGVISLRLPRFCYARWPPLKVERWELKWNYAAYTPSFILV